MNSNSHVESAENIADELERLRLENASLKKELHELRNPVLDTPYYNPEQWLNLLQDGTEMGLWASARRNGAVELYWSRGMFPLYGLESGNRITFEEWAARVHPDDFHKAYRPGPISQGEHEYKVEFRVIWPDRSIHWLLTRARIICDENDHPVGAIGFNLDITQRKQAEDRVRQTETLFRTLFQSIPDAVLATDGEGRYLDVNPAAIEMLGYTREEFLQMRSAELVNHSPEVSEKIWREFAERGNWQGEMELRRKDGRVILTDGRATVVNLPDGGTIGVALARDITEKRQAEEQFFKGQQLFQHIIDFSDNNIYVKDLEGRYLLVNRRVETVFGLGRQQIVGKTDDELFLDSPPEVRAEWRANDLAVQSSESPIQKEETVVMADGIHTVLTTKFPLRDTGGAIYAICGISTDITEQKKAEGILHRREQEFRALAENSPDIIARFDRNYRYLYINPAIERGTGIKPEQVVGTNSRELGSPEEVARPWEEKLDYVFSTGQEATLDFSWPYPDGSGLQYFQARFAPEFGPDGKVATVLALSRDITGQKRSEERLRFLSEVSTALASSLDYEDTLQKVASLAVPYLADFCLFDLWNEDGQNFTRAAVAFRDPAKEAIAREIDRRFPPGPESHPLAQVATGEAVLVTNLEEVLPLQALNEEHLALLQKLGPKSGISVPLQGQKGLIGALSFVTTEVARRFDQQDLELAEELARRAAMAIENARLYREAQQAIQTRQELDDLKDLFMALVGHELRTPLTSIKGYAQILQRQLSRLSHEGKERMLASAENIVYQSNRMNEMVKQLLDFSRIQNRQFELQPDPPQDLNVLVSRIVEQHRRSGKSHPILLELPAQPQQIALDTARFEQVLDNLITNAMKYSESGKTVRVAVQPRDGEVVISVQDEGRGISPEDQARIFSRFYRIKNNESGKVEGLGLGLYISSEIIHQHGGKMWVESEPGQGSTFFFSLPVHSGKLWLSGRIE